MPALGLVSAVELLLQDLTDCGSRVPALELVSAVELLLQDLTNYGSRVPALGFDLSHKL